VLEYYTDGKLKGTSNHRIIEDGKELFLKNHPEFKKVVEQMHVVDLEIDDETHSYKANERINHNTTSGGKALAFASSVRLRLKSMGQLKAKVNGVEQTIGIKTRCQVIKNRVGPPMRSAEFDIMFDSGINNMDGWLTVLKDYKLIRQGGAWYTYERKDGTELKFQAKDFADKVESDSVLKEELYNKICETLIMKYRSDNFSLDDIEVSDDPILED
jgi:hypothetical protein